MKKYLSEFPKLISEWHPIKNKDLKPENFTYGSNKKVWWKCPKGDDHEWQAAINSRSQRLTGCPFCSGNRPSKINNLLAQNPEFLSEWHSTKNKNLKPENFTLGSSKKIWWKCPKGDDHEWKATISHRNRGADCPFCAGVRVTKSNSLLVRNTMLVSEWHTTKNGKLIPEGFTPGSGKKVWWKCPKGDDHEWQATINYRNRGAGCPFCSGKKVSMTNNLSVVNPKLASEWHPTKNKDFKPENFTHVSQKKVWWECSKGEDHEWQATINSRYYGNGCPFCSGNRPSKINNLLAQNPEFLSQWHPIKNKDLKPENFTPGSNKLIWWKCPKGDDHEWQSSIKRRAKNNCPFCSGKRVSVTNNLSVVNPSLKDEWHPTKNGNLKPDEFTSGSSKKVWWKCPKGDDHEWKATISNRSSSNGTGCPFCSGSGTSKPEIRILCELRYLFGSSEVEWRGRVEDIEVDIILKRHSIGIEYDGSYWHKKKSKSDKEKNEFFEKKNISIIRVRERPLKVISNNDIVVSNLSLTKSHLNALVLKIKSIITRPEVIDFDSYINSPSFLNEKEFNRFISFLPSPPPEYSILNIYPDISEQWHFEKNSPLKPENFTHGSHKEVWWKCPKGDDHEWQAAIKSRTNGQNCPFCAGKRVSKNNMISAKLQQEWHPIKNKDLKPEEFTFGSKKKIWWECSKGEDHEWQATIQSRTNGQNCPFCAGKKASMSYNLSVACPELVVEWHPTKNGNLKPEEFTPGSGKKVWWKCSKDVNHEWQARIASRNILGSGCPKCYRLNRSIT